jgi:hypothetical protein
LKNSAGNESTRIIVADCTAISILVLIRVITSVLVMLISADEMVTPINSTLAGINRPNLPLFMTSPKMILLVYGAKSPIKVTARVANATIQKSLADKVPRMYRSKSLIESSLSGSGL